MIYPIWTSVCTEVTSWRRLWGTSSQGVPYGGDPPWGTPLPRGYPPSGSGDTERLDSVPRDVYQTGRLHAVGLGISTRSSRCTLPDVPGVRLQHRTSDRVSVGTPPARVQDVCLHSLAGFVSESCVLGHLRTLRVSGTLLEGSIRMHPCHVECPPQVSSTHVTADTHRVACVIPVSQSE